tara:strand:+ start:188 stop:505 length:318 start_codon:yes stop_codon:yes gene_type:complete
MLPSLGEGDIVFFKKYKKNKSKLKAGQIIIFNHPIKNKNLIKRVNLVNQNNVEVLGDNVKFSEDSNKFGLVNNERIIGIFTSKLIFPKLKNFLTHKNRSTSLDPK